MDEFDDFNHELVEIKKIIDEFEKEIGMVRQFGAVDLVR